MNENASFCDLHFHTYYSSDADNDPIDVLEAMSRSGCKGIAVTDHDALGANPIFLNKAADYGIDCLVGCEFDSDHPEFKHQHILAYGFDVSDSGIKRICDREQNAGKTVYKLALKKLHEEGFIESLDVFIEATRVSEHQCMGTTQIVKWMTKEHGWSSEVVNAKIKSVVEEDGFKHLSPHPQEIIDVVQQAGGVCVLAHPAAWTETENLEALIDEMANLGVVGAEAFTPSNKTEANNQMILKIVNDRGLIPTGGSDCHNYDGAGPWPSRAPISCFEKIKKALSQ